MTRMTTEFLTKRYELDDLRTLVGILGGKQAKAAVRTYTLGSLVLAVQGR